MSLLGEVNLHSELKFHLQQEGGNHCTNFTGLLQRIQNALGIERPLSTRMMSEKWTSLWAPAGSIFVLTVFSYGCRASWSFLINYRTLFLHTFSFLQQGAFTECLPCAGLCAGRGCSHAWSSVSPHGDSM